MMNTGIKWKGNRELQIGAVLTGVILLMTLIGQFALPYDPDAMDASLKFANPSLQHIMGCDQFGRDVFCRVIKGCGSSFLVAAGTVLLGTLGGILLGVPGGFFGGKTDALLMKLSDTLQAFPSFLLALLVVSLLGGGERNLILALGLAFIPSFTRIVREEVIRCRNLDFVNMARLAGASDLRIAFVHILPGALPVLISAMMIGFNNAVLAEAGMSYLGIGVEPPHASLGRMLAESQGYLLKHPSMVFLPGISLILLILGFSLLGEGLQKKGA